jgi:VCBS repeat-containing protein
VDYFRFAGGTGDTTVSVGVSEYVTNLDTEVRLFDANGALLGSSSPGGSFDATLSQTLTTGTYYVEVRGTGSAGVAGQYSLRIDTAPNTPPRLTSPISDVTVNEDAAPTVIDLGPHFEDSEDTDAQLTFSLVSHSNPALVTANFIAGLSLRLTYAANASGTAVLRVRATDRGGLWVEDEFQVTVLPVNDAPTAVNNSYQVDEDQQLTVNAPGVLGNDTDVEGSTLSAAVETLPAHGSLNFNSNGSFTYVPFGHYHGPDSFTYRASDGVLPSNVATVSITVRSVNDAPVAHPDDFSTDEDTPLTMSAPGLIWNDSDVDEDTLTAQKVQDPLHGSVVINANGSFTYTPAANYFGPDSFSYRVNDGALPSEPVVVTLMVWPVNDAPLAGLEHYTLDEDTSLTVDAPGLLGNDWDIESEPLTAAKASDPLHGTVSVNADGSFTYIPTANYFGPDSFRYTVSDGIDPSEPTVVTIQVSAVNDAPSAADDTAGVPQGQSRSIAVLANDTDPERDTLRVTAFTQGAKGRVSRVGSDIVYTPRAGMLGVDQFTYTIADVAGATATATVHVNILDTTAPRLTAVRLYYGTSGSAVANLSALSRSVLPWAGVHRVEFSFNEAVVIPADAVTLVGAFAGNIGVTSSYDAVTRTLSVTFAGPLAMDRYTLRLSASGVADVYGNPLAADWGKTFGVLPGDADGNGLVDDRDLSHIRRNYSRPGRIINRAADINGDGRVDIHDYNIAQANRGWRLA